jgi:predicted acylesterase/phospholipase RssA
MAITMSLEEDQDKTNTTEDITIEEKQAPVKKIKHIICSGGGVTGLSFYGALKNLNNKGIWNIVDIESIYGTSVGSLISVVISLNYEWNTLDDYFIKRPWENVFKMDMYAIIEIFQKKGVFDYNVFVEILSPLFKAKDISLVVTMKEFFEINNIDLHIFAVELNKFDVIDNSYKTHPEWKVIDAVYASCAIPLIFAPFFKDESCYCDGGFLINYPVEFCIKNGAKLDEILGIRGHRENDKKILPEHSLFDYILHLANKTHKRLLYNPKKIIKNEIIIPIRETTVQLIRDIAISMEERINLIEEGVKIIENFTLEFDV